jgi:hypothetical protein
MQYSNYNLCWLSGKYWLKQRSRTNSVTVFEEPVRRQFLMNNLIGNDLTDPSMQAYGYSFLLILSLLAA